MNYIYALISIIIAESAGILGAIFTKTGVGSWYGSIVKPSWNPPNWIFGPVWTTLYALMGTAAYLVWKSPAGALRTQALWLYAAQLVLNAFWSFAFFGLESPRVALVTVVVLLLFILATSIRFYQVTHIAGWLMVPYILWVSFATFLNATIVRLN